MRCIMESPFLSVGEAAELLRTSEKWIYQMLNRGELPGAKIGGIWFIDRQTLLDYLKSKLRG